MTTSKKTEKLKLQITGTQLDVPTLLQAKGRGCGGQVVFVLRPDDGHAVLLHTMGKDTTVWSCTSGRAPQAPTSPVDRAVAAAMVRRVKAVVATKKQARPAWRGDWKGMLVCDGGVPAIVLERKVGTYVAVKVVGGGGKPGWTAEVVRTERWFSPKDAKVVEAATLAKVIPMALDQAEVLTSSACVTRDTRRRAELDPVYAAAHPPRAPKRAPKDAVEGWLQGQKLVDPDKLPALEPPSCPTSTSSIATATKQEAEALKATMGSIWMKTQTADVMQRASALIQRAKALVASPVCTGALKAEAQEALSSALYAWREARAAASREAAAAPLRKAAVEIAKTADRVARSCITKGKTVRAPVSKAPAKVQPSVARLTDEALGAAARRDRAPRKAPVVAQQASKPAMTPTSSRRAASNRAPVQAPVPLEDLLAAGIERAAKRMGL